MNKTTCYTYFSICGDFDPDAITEMLQLTPDNTWKSTDLRKDGKPYGFSRWTIGRCDEYNVDTSIQMRKTISALLPKSSILNEIREKFYATLCLETIPEIYSDESVPALAPDMDIIDFCHHTRTHLDIDCYVIE